MPLTGGLRVKHARSGRQALAAACLLLFVGAGCTPEVPLPPPPTTSAPTPTENAQEREERLAYEAAEKSYREFRAEVERVYARGGAPKPTAGMTALAGGPYLASYQKVSEAYSELKHHSEGRLDIVYVHRDGFSSTELILDTCEDSRRITTFDRNGKKLYVGDVRKLRLSVRAEGAVWKVWSGTGERAAACA